MTDSRRSLRSFLPVAGCLASGLAGATIARTYAFALDTSPAWLGPTILVGSLALLMMGVLLIPAAIRSSRRGRPGA